MLGTWHTQFPFHANMLFHTFDGPGCRQPADAPEKSVPDEIDTRTFWLSALVDPSEDAIISNNLSGLITSWNRGAQRLFGFTPEEAVGQASTLIVPADLHEEETHRLSR